MSGPVLVAVSAAILRRVPTKRGRAARLSRYGDTYENRVTGERAVVLRGDEDGAGEPALVHLTVKPGGAVAGEHVHPRLQERFRVIATLFGLANAGKTNAKGLPNPFQLALIAREFADVIQFTRPPAPVQTVLFAILGAAGRLRGYRGVYPEYLHPHGRVTPDPEVVALAGVTPPAAEPT
jgi:hypothetical protein